MLVQTKGRHPDQQRTWRQCRTLASHGRRSRRRSRATAQLRATAHLSFRTNLSFRFVGEWGPLHQNTQEAPHAPAPPARTYRYSGEGRCSASPRQRSHFARPMELKTSTRGTEELRMLVCVDVYVYYIYTCMCVCVCRYPYYIHLYLCVCV